MHGNNIFVVRNDSTIYISQVLNDCVGGLCVPTNFGESLTSILKKICNKITTLPSYNIKTTDISNWNSAYNKILTSAEFTEDTEKILTLTLQDGTEITASFTDPQASTDLISSPLLSEEDDIFTIDGVKIRDTNSTTYTTYFDFPSNVLTGGSNPKAPIENLTFEGALSTATIVPDGQYDKITVTNGDISSRVMFNEYILSDANVKYTLKVKVNTKGSATSYVGIILRNIGLLNDASSGSKATLINLNDQTIYRHSNPGNVTTQTAMTSAFNGSGTFCSNNDILEFVWICDGLKGEDIIAVMNLTTGMSITARTGIQASEQQTDGFCNSAQKVGIILTGGTSGVYTLINFKAESIIPNRSKLLACGDSMCSGYTLGYPDTIYSLLTLSLPFNIDSFSGSGTNLEALSRTLCIELLKKRPEVVLYIGYLPMFFNDMDSGDGDYATFYAAWTKLMKTIQSINAIPIVAKGTTTPVWPVGDLPKTTVWNAFVDAEMATYNGLVLDLSTTEYTYLYDGGVGFHFGVADNLHIKSKLITLLTDNNLL